MALWILIFCIMNAIAGLNALAAVVTEVSVNEKLDLQLLIHKAPKGSVLLLKPGIYLVDSLVISKPLTLKGEKGAVIRQRGDKDTLIVSETEYVTLEGLSIEGSGQSTYEDFAAIKVKNSQHIHLIRNTIRNSQYGIMLQNSHESLIEQNHVQTDARPAALLGDGIHLWKSTRNKIKENHIHGHRDGIYLEFSRDGVIEGNVSQSNIRYGLHFMFCDQNEFRGNQFIANDAGVAVMYSKHILMRNNLFRLNKGAASYGLLLKDISDSDIFENTLDQNTVAIFMEGSSRNRLRKNKFQSNAWAVRLLSSCDSNRFEGNSFLRNTNEVSSNALQSENEFIGNYWLAHSNADLDGDGRADLPYQPTDYFSYLLEKYHLSIVLTDTPLIAFLNWAEKFVPSISPLSLKDPRPLMKPDLGSSDDKS
jgi:nitrous oxidase accessory protein